MKYFWADPHFFHGNIITKIKHRPEFKDVNHMNNELIKIHNSIVDENDDIYCLGDFAMLRKDQISKIKPILDKLNGNHHLILGNHDEGKPFTYINMGFMSIHTSLYVDEFLLLHDPSMAVVVPKTQKVLCGHLHNLTKWVSSNILNVGVDIWDYKPLSIDYIRQIFLEKEKEICD